MTAPPKRRWFSFSLRTMFVVVTVVGVWLGWQLSIVRERKAVLAELRKIAPNAWQEDDVVDLLFGAGSNYQRVPVVRHWLGDEYIVRIFIPAGAASELVERVEIAFPEAILFADNYHAWRDSLTGPGIRRLNSGTIFKTGLIEK